MSKNFRWRNECLKRINYKPANFLLTNLSLPFLPENNLKNLVYYLAGQPSA